VKEAGQSNDHLLKFQEHGIMTTLWDNNFEKLVSYKEKYGKLPSTKEKGLGRWIGNQRLILNKVKEAGQSNDRLLKFEQHGIIS